MSNQHNRLASHPARQRACALVLALLLGALLSAPVGAQPGDVLLSDDLRDPTTGLMPESAIDGEAEYGYRDGEYRVALLPSRSISDLTIAVGQTATTDSAISVQGRLAGDTSGHQLLVTCRHSTDGYYLLSVTPEESSFYLLRVTRPNNLPRVAMLAVGALLPLLDPTASQRLELRCVGTTISAALNGLTVVTVADNVLTTGAHHLGVGAATFGSAADARFTDVVISGP